MSAPTRAAARSPLPPERIPIPGCGTEPRSSRRARWRAVSLLLVHAAVAAHVAHWKLSGSTLTPLEPSEAGDTLTLGYVNAGFLLFGLLILSTIILGRFFCGWACHVVAYQDACAWLLKKVGLRPRPIRSRLLVWVPLLAAVEMFALPSVLRWLDGAGLPDLTWHLSTEDFWQRFPGPWMTALTLLVDGFLVVWLLGAKGFCTYGCPYGALFSIADRVSPTRIRVTDACEHCGHCTSVCTSNVQVHLEVARHGAVVDPGCMKCMDCVNVCPKDALYLGTGALPLRAGKPPKRQSADFSWGEEALMAVVFLVGLYGFRSLYGAVPFLLSLGLAVTAALAAVLGLRLVRDTELEFQGRWLKRGDALTGAGRVAAVAVLLYLAHLGHAVWVQAQTREGMRLAHAARSSSDPLERRALLAKGQRYLEGALQSGWTAGFELLNVLGQVRAAGGDAAGATALLERALDARPESLFPGLALADALVAQGQPERALASLGEVFEAAPRDAGELGQLAAALGRLGQRFPRTEGLRELALRIETELREGSGAASPATPDGAETGD